MSLPYHILYKYRSTEGCPKGFERIDLNDDLKGLLHHIETDSIIINSIFEAVGRPDKTFKDWYRNDKTLEFLQETYALYVRDEHNRLQLRVLVNGGENSMVPENSKNDVNYYVKRIFINIPDKGVPKRYHKFTGWLCPRLLVHKLGGWANPRYEVKLHAFLTNHYTDDYVQELKREKESLEEKLERMHRESMAKMDEQGAEIRSLREENIEQHKKTRAVIKRVQKQATRADKSIDDIADAVTSKNTDGLLLISKKHAGSLRGGKPTTILKCNAIENKSITKGAYTDRINKALIKISCRHPKDAFRVLAKFLDDLHLLVPFPNGKKYDGNIKEFRVFDDKLERIKRTIKDNLPDQLNGAIINIRSEIESINEAVKDIAD